MSEQWGPWIEHDGKGCPVPNGTWVRCMFDKGRIVDARVTANGRRPAQSAWHWIDGLPNIVRYRVRKPLALQNLIDMIAVLPVNDVVPA